MSIAAPGSCRRGREPAAGGCAELTRLQEVALALDGPAAGLLIDGSPALVSGGAAPG